MADGQTLTKRHLTRMVAKRTGLANPKAKYIVDAVLFSLAELIVSLEGGDRIELRGFGVFKMKFYFPDDVRYRNPRTSEKVVVAARRKLIFKPSKLIKQELLKI